MKRFIMACAIFPAALLRAGTPAPIHPVRVCDLMRDPAAWRGKVVAVIGRYSFRENGRYMSEEACESRPASNGTAWANSVRLSLDPKQAPGLPDNFDIDAAAAGRELQAARKATALGKFRFGSIEYDRWAVVYGRVEPTDDNTARVKPVKGLEPAPVVLVYRGDGMIFFINGD